jgi:hypothetical protein
MMYKGHTTFAYIYKENVRFFYSKKRAENELSGQAGPETRVRKGFKNRRLIPVFFAYM